jgi:hypothetical protein
MVQVARKTILSSYAILREQGCNGGSAPIEEGSNHE